MIRKIFIGINRGAQNFIFKPRSYDLIIDPLEGDTDIVLERIKAEFRTLLQGLQPEWNLPF
jgi:hypothetical protein